MKIFSTIILCITTVILLSACNSISNNNYSSGSYISHEVYCSQGKGEYCFSLGWSYANGENGYTKDYSKAKSFYEKACKLNNENGCSNSGYMYIDGLGTAQDYQNAKMYFNKACSLGLKESCNIKISIESSSSNISYEDQCSQGKVYYCFALGQYYANGQKGYIKNNTKSKYFFERLVISIMG